MSRFVQFARFGGLEVLDLVDVAVPEPAAGQVRVKVKAAGLNPVDYKLLADGAAANVFGFSSFPSGNGNDFSGVIDEVGDSVAGYTAGDAVFGGARFFAQADFVVVDAARVIRKPEGLTFEQAGSLDIVGRTACASVRSLALDATDTVLISAAAGGVGILACQLALRTGATVVGTAGIGNHDFLRALGVIPVAYGDGLVDRIRAVVPRVTAVLDNNGASTIDAGLALGVAGRRINTIAARGHASDRGITGVGGAEANPGDLLQLAELISAGEVVFPIDSVYPLERFREAYERLVAGHLRGKIVLVTD